jgi:hypothetical protein
MEEEIVGRQETSKKLEDLAVIRANKEEILDKKRKFLDDIPSQMAAVLAATSDIKVRVLGFTGLESIILSLTPSPYH